MTSCRIDVCNRLEYKYMKLVTPADGKDDAELPAAETCALDDDDDDEEDSHYDASVQFKDSNKSATFFSKIKKMGGKKVRADHVAALVSPPSSCRRRARVAALVSPHSCRRARVAALVSLRLCRRARVAVHLSCGCCRCHRISTYAIVHCDVY